jgi:hypothetical protein
VLFLIFSFEREMERGWWETSFLFRQCATVNSLR